MLKRSQMHGYRVRVVPTTYEGIGVDTPEDVVRAERLLASQAGALEGRGNGK